MAKNFIATAIILLGIAGVYFVIQQGTDLAGPSLNYDKTDQTKNNNLVSNKPFVENLPENHPITEENSNSSITQKENLTDSLTKGIGNALNQYNPSGAINLNGQQKIGVPDPEKLSENLLSEATQKFDPDSLKPGISDSDLKISNDNGKKALETYFKNFNRIINDSAALLSKETLSATEINPSQFDEFILMYDTAYKNLKAASVPSDLVKIHRQELELLGAKSAIYQALKNYEKDPLLSILASQSLEKFDQDFTVLNKEINDFIKKSNI